MAEEELRYSAGSIMLQVIPSLRDAQRKIGKDAKNFGDALERGMGDGMEKGAERGAKAVKESLSKVGPEGKKAGQRAGEEFGSAYEKAVRPHLEKAVASIGRTTDVQMLGIKNRLKQLARDIPRIGFDIDSDAFHHEVQKATQELERLAVLNPTTKLRVDAGQAHRELATATKAIRQLDGRRANIDINVRGAGKAAGELNKVGKEAAAAKRNVDDTGNAFRAFNGILLATAALGPAVVPVLAAIAGGMLALGPAAAVGVAGLGITALGLSGIGDAVTALGEAQTSAAKDSVASARTMRNAQQGVSDALKSMSRARQDAAKSAEDAQRRVDRAEADAAKNAQAAADRVVRAKEQAARASEQALKRQEQAEKRLADAQRDAKKAQDELADARRQAQKDLDDIADRTRQNALDRRQAVLDLFNATVENNAIQQDPGSTNYEREQASINLGNAQERLAELREEEKDLADQKTKTDREGVDGTDRVKTAQERLSEALLAQKEAQQGVTEAAKEARQVQLEGAREIKQAIADQQATQREGDQAIADARRAQDDAALQSRRSLEDAQLALARANQAYKDALYDTGEAGSTAMQKVKEAMGKLGPEGQAFALFIHGLRDDFYAIRNIVAAGLLPGLQKAIENVMAGAGPGFSKFLFDMAKAIGEVAVAFSESLTGPAWQGFFKVLADFGPEFIDVYGDAFILWLEAGASLMTISAPLALAFAKGFKGIADQVAKFMASPAAQELIDDFFAWLVENGPALQDFFVALVRAVVALAIALAPIGMGILKVLTEFFEFLADMDPENLRLLSVAVLAIVVGFQLIAGVLGPLAAILTVIEVLGLTAGLVVAAIFAVILVLILLYTKSETARKIINFVLNAIWEYAQWVFTVQLPFIFSVLRKVWDALLFGMKWTWENILQPVFSKIAEIATWLWINILWPTFQAIGNAWSELFGTMKWAWENILWPVLKTLGTIVFNLWWYGMKQVFGLIRDGWDLLGKAFGIVWRNLIRPIIDAFVDAMGGKKGLQTKIQSAVTMIGKAWAGLKELAKGPIDFVVNTVINKGLIGAYNALANQLPGLPSVSPIPWPPPGWTATNPKGPLNSDGGHTPGFYNGGVTGVMPGYTPGRDVFSIHVSGGEAVMRPEWTRAIKAMDPNYIDAANAAAKRGGVLGVQRFLGGYRDGGEVAASDYTRTVFRGRAMNFRTIKMLLAAEKLAGDTFRITQGSYSTSEAASGGTHAGGGVLDISGADSTSRNEWASRKAGFAAWIRTPNQGPWPRHMHMVALGDPTASGSAKNQMASYLRGGDGLGGKDTGVPVTIDPSLIDQIGGFIGDLIGGAAGWVKDAVGNPAKYLLDKITDPLKAMGSQFGDNTLTKIAAGIPKALMAGMVTKIKGAFGFGGDPADAGAGGSIRSMVQNMAAANYGWTGANWEALNWLVNKESSWNPNAQNPSSTAFGLFQFLDSTWKGVGGEKTSDPQRQAELGLKYIAQRYGSPTAAAAFHRDHNWYSDGGEVQTPIVDAIGPVPSGLYDDGGMLPPGLSMALNLTGGNEHKAVFTTEQWEALKMQAKTGAGQTIINVPMQPTNATPEAVASSISFEQRKVRHGGRYSKAGKP